MAYNGCYRLQQRSPRRVRPLRETEGPMYSTRLSGKVRAAVRGVTPSPKVRNLPLD